MDEVSSSRGSLLLYAWGQGTRKGSFGRHAILWTPRPVSAFDGTGEMPMGVTACQRRLLAWTSSGDCHIWRQSDGKRVELAIALPDWIKAPAMIKVEEEESDNFGHAQTSEKRMLASSAAVASTFAVATAMHGEGVFSWGANSVGQLGVGDTLERREPCELTALRGKHITALAVGEEHVVCLVDLDPDPIVPAGQEGQAQPSGGEVYSWGGGDFGRLGHGSQKPSLVPRLVSSLRGHRVISVSCGAFHTATATSSGEVFTWGRQSNGRLGHGGVSSDIEAVPRLVEALESAGISLVACGEAHTLCSNQVDTLWGFGWNSYGQLGVGDNNDRSIPSAVRPAGGGVWNKLLHIACGEKHSSAVCASSGTSECFMWGCGEFGQLGHGSQKNQDQPKQLTALEGKDVIYTVLGGDFSCAVVRVMESGPPEGARHIDAIDFGSIQGTEITLVRQLVGMEEELKVIRKKRGIGEQEMKFLRNAQEQARVDHEEWLLLCKQLEGTISVRQKKREEGLKLLEAAGPDDAGRPLEACIKELKVVLGEQEEGLLRDTEALRNILLENERKTLEPIDLEAAKPITSAKQYRLARKKAEAECEWEGAEGSRLRQEIEDVKLTTKADLEAKVASLKEEAAAGLEAIKTALFEDDGPFQDLFQEEQRLMTHIRNLELQAEKADSNWHHMERDKPGLEEGLQVSKAIAEQMVLDWEMERLSKADATSALEAKQGSLLNQRTKNLKLKKQLQETLVKIEADNEAAATETTQIEAQRAARAEKVAERAKTKAAEEKAEAAEAEPESAPEQATADE